jgi:hypothetical protein
MRDNDTVLIIWRVGINPPLERRNQYSYAGA